MNRGPVVEIFPMRSGIRWPDAISDVRSANLDCKELRLSSSTKSTKGLDRFSMLARLWCFKISREKLIDICECASLENLYIDTSNADDVACLKKLGKLRILSLERFTKLYSIELLGGLGNLEGLAILDFKNIDSISPLARLTNLRQLAVAGGMWSRMHIDTLQPLESLTELRFLHLTNLKPKDESLRPLAELLNLESLEIANFYPMEEFAWLAGKLKRTNCSWFRPYVKAPFSCRSCGHDTVVILTGKGKPSLCKTCDATRLDKHVTQFNEIVAKAS